MKASSSGRRRTSEETSTGQGVSAFARRSLGALGARSRQASKQVVLLRWARCETGEAGRGGESTRPVASWLGGTIRGAVLSLTHSLSRQCVCISIRAVVSVLSGFVTGDEAKLTAGPTKSQA
jgi:hypothetical protein